MTREGEAPAEPWRRPLGRSLALPLYFTRLGIGKMITGVVSPPCPPGKSLAAARLIRLLDECRRSIGCSSCKTEQRNKTAQAYQVGYRI